MKTAQQIGKAAANIKRLTNINAHCEAALHLARFFGKREAFEKLTAIETAQDKQGFLSSEQINERWKITSEILEVLKVQYGYDTYQKFYSAF